MPLRPQHRVDPGIGCCDDEHTKTLEAPTVEKGALLAAVEVAEVLSPNAGFADQAIGPDVHAAEVLLKSEVVARVGIDERKEAIGDDFDGERPRLMTDGDAYAERSSRAFRRLGHVR